MASDPTTWDELKATLANWLNRDDLSAAEIPEAIALAERRFQRTVFSPERETETTLAASSRIDRSRSTGARPRPPPQTRRRRTRVPCPAARSCA